MRKDMQTAWKKDEIAVLIAIIKSRCRARGIIRYKENFLLRQKFQLLGR